MFNIHKMIKHKHFEVLSSVILTTFQRVRNMALDDTLREEIVICLSVIALTLAVGR
jgi:hypothetical protein